MKTDSKDIVQRLRESGTWAMACSVDICEASDYIEALQQEVEALKAENEILRETLSLSVKPETDQ